MNNNPRSSAGAQTGAANAVRVEGKSLEQALVKAAGVLGLTQDEVGYKIVKEETAKGLFSFFKSPVVEISAWPKAKSNHGSRREGRSRDNRDNRDSRDGRDNRGGNDRRGGRGREERAARGDRPERQERARPSRRDDDFEGEELAPAEPLSAERVEELQAELRDFCSGIVSRIAGEPVTVTSTLNDNRLVLDIQNEFFAQQIAKNSKLAEAMEHILRKKPRHLRQELPFRIFVDVSGVRRQREDDLIQMAFDLSAKVHENKRPIVLNYKSSYDRKIIHMALDKDERVYTKSIGSGPNRKLMILPSRGGDADAPVTEMPPID